MALSPKTILSLFVTAVAAVVGTFVAISISGDAKIGLPPSSPLDPRRAVDERHFRRNLLNSELADPRTVELRPTARAECVRRAASIRLPALVARLLEDPETNGLVPQDLGPAERVEGLDLSVFRGKRIVMMGDSTLFYPTKWLYALMTKLEHEEGADDPQYDKMTVSEGSALAIERAHQLGMETYPGTMLFSGRGKPFHITALDGTRIEWTGMAGMFTVGQKESIVKSMFQYAESMKPQIVVANFGVHWLHLCGFKICPSEYRHGCFEMCPSESDTHGHLGISRWVNYKRDFLQRVYDMAVKVGADLLLFKTSNFICAMKRTVDWAPGSSRYLSFDEKTLDDCYRENMKFSGVQDISADDILRYCRYGQFTEVGSNYLNQQVEEFVAEIHEANVDSRLTVGIFKDHDIQGCDDTEDGVHHFSSMMMRLRLLANTIESYSECSDLSPISDLVQ